jgi:ribosomal protein S12 methylthiotransferase
VGKQTKAKRWAEVMERQAEISAQWNQTRIGSKIRVLVETYDAERGVHLARGAAEAPEVDGLVLIEGANTIGPGGFVTVEITGAEVYDVRGRVVKE